MTNPERPPSRPVSEDDLHGYVDGRLSEERRRTVEAWLGDHPREAARLRDWHGQSDALRATLGPVESEAVPARLRLAVLIVERRRRLTASLRRIAASVGLFVLGAAAGSGIERLSDARRAGQPMADALAAHRVYADRAPGDAVELAAASGTRALAAELSGAAGWQVPVPDLAPLGLTPLGGRVLPSQDGLAALIVYEGRGGIRLSVFVRHSRRDGPALPEIVQREASLRAAIWFRGGFGHAVVAGDVPADLLLRAAALAGG